MADDKQELQKTKKEASWWLYAAWTAPFVALAALFFLQVIGWAEIYEKSLVIGSVIFFSVAVFWWFWAVYKIKFLADVISKSVDNFKDIKDTVREIRDHIKD